MKPRLKVYFGKVCAKHPELKGERYLNNRNCVGCDSYAARIYHEENREAILARKRKYREENKEHSLTYDRERNAAFKEKHGICRCTYYRRLKKEQQCAI